jgi:hypothetical protein
MLSRRIGGKPKIADNPFEKFLRPSLKLAEDFFNIGISVIKVGPCGLSLQSCLPNVIAVWYSENPNPVPVVEAKPPEVMARNKVLVFLLRTHGRSLQMTGSLRTVDPKKRTKMTSRNEISAKDSPKSENI